jgi:hypothetical protein
MVRLAATEQLKILPFREVWTHFARHLPVAR